MSLTQIADNWGTDKGNLYQGHMYTPIYERYLSKFLTQTPVFVEIGLHDPRFPGASMRMWDNYFPSMEMYGFDILDCEYLVPDYGKIKVFKGDQGEERDLLNFIHKFNLNNRLDFIIDDGSHEHQHIVTSFKILYQSLKKNGVYFIEDLDAEHSNRDKTITDIMNYIFLNKLDCHHIEYLGKILIIVK
jgi:hypothetical protein